jgi:hypothetical protein
MQLFHKILPETRKLTMNKYGSRVVQTAFSYITQEQHAEWTKARAFFTHSDLFREKGSISDRRDANADPGDPAEVLMRFSFDKNSGFPIIFYYNKLGEK